MQAKKIYSDRHIQIVGTRRMMSAGSAFGEKLHQVSWTCFSRPISDDVQLSEEPLEELEVPMKVNYNARMMPVKRSDVPHSCASEVLVITSVGPRKNFVVLGGDRFKD